MARKKTTAKKTTTRKRKSTAKRKTTAKAKATTKATPKQTSVVAKRNAKIIALRKSGMAYRKIADEVGVHNRTAFHVIKEEAPELMGRVS